MGFPTPDVPRASLSLTCRQIRIPDHPDWLRIVSGALVALIDEAAYEVYGSVTPADTAAYFREEFFSFTASECSPPVTIPIGSINAFAGAVAPTHYLLCDGAAVSRTTYAGLFAVIGTTYGAGDGATTFNLPDMRDRAATGASATRAPGTQYGEASVILTDLQMPSHRHFNQFVSASYYAWSATLSTPGVGAQLYTSAPGTPNVNNVQFTNHTGDTQPHPNLPPSLSLNFIIYAGG